MSREPEADCCEYREERRRLELKKLRKKTRETKDRPKNRIDDCDEDNDDDEKDEKHNCEEKRARRVEKLAKLISPTREMMERIKPSIEDREKYSMDARHVRCFLEPAELEKLEIEEKMLTISRSKPCDSGQESRIKKTKGTRPLSKKEERKKYEEDDDDDDSKDTVDHQRANDESGPEIDEQREKSKSKGGREKRIKGEFWCPEVRQKVDAKLRDSWQDDIDCSNSICSFDSHINLSGLSLTVNEMKKIAETRRNRMISSTVESKDATQ